MAYQNIITYDYHLALIKGEISRKRRVPIRIHSSCITGDIFGSQKCDCGEQLHKALQYIEHKGYGAVLYLFQEGRGINIINKIKAYELQSAGLDTVEANESLGFPAELRQYDVVRDILENLEVKSIDLITNNPDKLNKLQDLGVIVENLIPINIIPSEHSEKYYQTKIDKMGHSISTNIEKDVNTSNNIELEVKFPVASKNVDQIRRKLLAIPRIFYEGRTYEKTTMLDNDNRLMEKDDARFRVREIATKKESTELKIELSYKRRLNASGGIKSEEEIGLPFIGNPTALFSILEKIGYLIISSYERYRETYKLGKAKITLDEFPFGYLFEIEGAEKDILKICNLLNLNVNKSYARSCDDFYSDLCNSRNITPKSDILFNDSEMPHIE